MVSKNKLGFPSTYRELLKFFIRISFLIKLIFYYNLIAHEYYKISEKELKEMVKLLKSANKFVNDLKKKEVSYEFKNLEPRKAKILFEFC